MLIIKVVMSIKKFYIFTLWNYYDVTLINIFDWSKPKPFIYTYFNLRYYPYIIVIIQNYFEGKQK